MTHESLKRKLDFEVNIDTKDSAVENTADSKFAKSKEVLVSLQELKMLVAKKEETVRRMKMVLHYQKDTSMTDLKGLIVKWRCICQDVVIQLFEEVCDPKPDMKSFLKHLNVNPDYVAYSEESESLTSLK